jgi:hypothetical protein
MALFFECMQQCAQKVLDTADIVREAILQQMALGTVLAAIIPSVMRLSRRRAVQRTPEHLGAQIPRAVSKMRPYRPCHGIH